MNTFIKSLKMYFFLASMEVLLAGIYLLTIPGNPGTVLNAGSSGMRMAALILLGFLLTLFVFLWLQFHYKIGWFDKIQHWMWRFYQRKSLINLSSVGILGAILSIYLLIRWLLLPDSYEYSITLPRLLPLAFLSLVLWVQFYVLVIYPGQSIRTLRFRSFLRWVQSDIPAGNILLDLMIIAVLLVAASILGQWIKYFTPYYSYLDFLIVEFFVDSEENIPTYFSGLILLFSAFLLAVKGMQVRKSHGRYGFHWTLLSFLFVYLAVDEVVQIHERLSEPVRSALHTSGALFFAWYLPVLPLLLLIGLYYWRFVFALPRRQKIGYILAGGLYLFGVLGVEIIGSSFGYNYGLGNFPYTLISALEEFSEMSGVILFIFFTWELLHQTHDPEVLAKE